MQIKKTTLADEDLIDIFIYGSQNFGQSRAESYYAELNKAFLFLAKNPLACPERIEFEPSVCWRRVKIDYLYRLKIDQGFSGAAYYTTLDKSTRLGMAMSSFGE